MKKICNYKNLTLFFENNTKSLYLISKKNTDIDSVFKNCLEFINKVNISKIILVVNGIEINVKQENTINSLKNQYNSNLMEKNCWNNCNYHTDLYYNKIYDDENNFEI